jgi:hypothetical protein
VVLIICYTQIDNGMIEGKHLIIIFPYYLIMESKNKIKPNWFITSKNENLEKFCRICGGSMEKVLHTPKNKPPIYHCVRCNTYSREYHFGISDL